MSRMDDELKSAFRREPAPPGFAGRVLARAAQQDARERRIEPREGFSSVLLRVARGYALRPLVRWAAVGTACAVLVIGSIHYRSVQRQRAEGEAAKERLMLALRIAGNKLQLARTKVHEISDNESDNQQEKE